MDRLNWFCSNFPLWLQNYVDINDTFYLNFLKKAEIAQIPMEYMLMKAKFLDFEVDLSLDVLIPRVETEQIVEVAKKFLENIDLIVDLGTGSGVIARAFEDKKKVLAVDISFEALLQAKKNLKKSLLINMDGLSALRKKTNVMVISNFPYVTDNFAYSILYEPQQALFFNEKILDEILNYEPTVVVLEMEENMASYLMRKFDSYPNKEIKKDLFGKDRFFVAYDD